MPTSRRTSIFRLLPARRGVAGVESVFRATIETGEGPTIAIMCEYDALPSIGHACGHNAIATAGAGAGAGLAAVRDKLPKGRIHVIGTPRTCAQKIAAFLEACALDGLMLIFADYAEGLRVTGREILPLLKGKG